MGSRSPPTQGTLHPAYRSGDMGVTGQSQPRAIKWAARLVCPRGGGRAGLRTLQKPVETPVASKANVPVHETPPASTTHCSLHPPYWPPGPSGSPSHCSLCPEDSSTVEAPRCLGKCHLFPGALLSFCRHSP